MGVKSVEQLEENLEAIKLNVDPEKILNLIERVK